uniref:Uncharacterized protein n=1 Tax=Anguilla anguilla TaxID=7936 RepID=A0A0E9W453_ANGAN
MGSNLIPFLMSVLFSSQRARAVHTHLLPFCAVQPSSACTALS